MIVPKVRNDKSDIPKSRKRQGALTENSVGKRLFEKLNGRELGWLAKETGIPVSTLSDYVQRGISKADNAVKIARALGTTVEYLMEGHGPRGIEHADLIDISKADWVHLSWFDLRELTEDAKGAVIETVPFRRDWLNRRILRSTGLWITELPSDFSSLGLSEGDAVICSDLSAPTLYENWICIFRGLGGPFVARYSNRSVHDGSSSDGFSDPLVSAADIAAGDIHPVARIHARILAKL